MTAPAPTGPVRHFCTYFDKNYLSRGLSLYHSLGAHHPSARLYVCCFDEETFAYLKRAALPDLVAIPSSALEAHDPQFAAARAGRTLLEYYFTSTPCWIRFVLDRFPEVELITYLDADLRFFASSEPAFAELGGDSVAIVEHRFLPHLRHLDAFGRFNVGWLSFRRDLAGLACLNWWRERCIEWCYDRVEPERMGDQKYLDRFPRLFDKVKILGHKGVDAAPWNLDVARVRSDGSAVWVDGQELICFHFQGLKHLAGSLYESGLRSYGVEMVPVLRRHVFEPYLLELTRHEAALVREGIGIGRARSWRSLRTGLRRLLQLLTRPASVARLLWSGTQLWAPQAGSADLPLGRP